MACQQPIDGRRVVLRRVFQHRLRFSRVRPHVTRFRLARAQTPAMRSQFAGGRHFVPGMNSDPVVREEDSLAGVFPRHVAFDAARLG